jgi:hypothetical protein
MRPSKPPPEPALTPAEEQEKWLHEATTAVKQHAFYMKRAIDESNLKDALKHSSVMLSELRTSRLSPQKYYALFMRACDEMRYLEGFFSDLAKGGRRCEEDAAPNLSTAGAARALIPHFPTCANVPRAGMAWLGATLEMATKQRPVTWGPRALAV